MRLPAAVCSLATSARQRQRPRNFVEQPSRAESPTHPLISPKRRISSTGTLLCCLCALLLSVFVNTRWALRSAPNLKLAKTPVCGFQPQCSHETILVRACALAMRESLLNRVPTVRRVPFCRSGLCPAPYTAPFFVFDPAAAGGCSHVLHLPNQAVRPADGALAGASGLSGTKLNQSIGCRRTNVSSCVITA